jgi:malonate-semialdehyde dehydrogenase (acetylating)/methylmalonate-semialdehyde dehydrogenase
VATGIPSLMMGSNLEDIASGIDELMIRQPVGVVGVIAPFNFPGMIPLWFLPYAVACGNTLVLKPSEKTPMTMAKIFQLAEQAGFPPGVLNLVHGGKDAVDALLDHPGRARDLVRRLDQRGALHLQPRRANGKRVQCQGGAKNPVIVLPDADLEMTTKIVADSAFGCAGQRCLASSVVITVADAGKPFTEQISAAASARKVGYGLESGIEMGPVISPESRTRSRAHRRGRRRRCQADRGRDATRRSPATRAATSCGPRCSPTWIPPASSRARRCSAPCSA